MYVCDVDNGQVVIFGFCRFMELNIIIVGSIIVWDFKKRYVQVIVEVKIFCFFNVYIFYCKDQQVVFKVVNFGIFNNDICKLLFVVFVNDLFVNIMQLL